MTTRSISERESAYENSIPFSLNISWNDGLVASLNQTQNILPSSGTADDGLRESVRISDASDIYQEVELRYPEHQKYRSMRRPIAILSDFFTAKRTKSFSSYTKYNKTPELPPRNRLSADEVRVSNPKCLKKKKSIWSLISKGKNFRDTNSTTEQNMTKKCAKSLSELNVTNGSYVKFETFDDIFDLNSFPVIHDMMKSAESNANTSSMAMGTKRTNVSMDLLWSHNLSGSHSSQGDISDINLIGANVNREQIHSEIFIEQDSRQTAFGISAPKDFLRFRKFNAAEVDENGYAVMRPIIADAKKHMENDSMHTTYVSIDDIARHRRNLEFNYDVLPTKSTRKLSFDSQSSSGCSSDSEDLKIVSQTEEIKFSEANSDDEAISLEYNEVSPLSTPTKSTTIHCERLLGNDCEEVSDKWRQGYQEAISVGSDKNCAPSTPMKSKDKDCNCPYSNSLANQDDCDCDAFEFDINQLPNNTPKCKNIARSSTPLKINHNWILQPIATTPSNRSPSIQPTNIETINDLQVVETQPSNEPSGKYIDNDSGIIEKISNIRPTRCCSTSNLVHEHGHSIEADEAESKSFSKRIAQTYSEIRIMAFSLMSVRRALLNFA